jgi:hypothetical protein
MIDPAYNDEDGQKEINGDQMIITPVQQNDQYLQGMQQQGV